MTNLIGLDRDGTLIYDDNDKPGSAPNWKELIKILPGVVEGVRLLNTISDLEAFIISTQVGVALSDPQFSLLTEERAEEFNRYLIELLGKEGAKIKGSFYCPWVTKKERERQEKKGFHVDPKYLVESHPDIKPGIGMLEKAAQTLGKTLEECRVFYIGDRLSDVKTSLNANGTGILVSSVKTIELGDEEKVRQLQKVYPDRVYIGQDFLDAARYIERVVKI